MTIINDTGLGLGKRITTARMLAELDQADVARALGVARTTISNWERGLAEPPVTHFVRLAAITGQPLEWFAAAIDVEEVSRLRESNSRPSHYKVKATTAEAAYTLALLFILAAVKA